MYNLSDYNYDLPKDRIAQVPSKDRSRSRLLHLERSSGRISHTRFSEVPQLLREDDLLVINNTRVVPARLFGKKETGGQVEVLIIDYTGGMNSLETTGFFECDCLIRASKSPKKGTLLCLENNVKARVISVDQYISRVRFLNGQDFPEFLNRFGRMPLPPYIKREDETSTTNDFENYQTVYAREKGAVAAPTAGLHFTEPLMAQLKKKRIDLAQVTLHVGYGTFVPVRVADIRDHEIHSEFFTLSPEAADSINQAKDQGRRVVAVGTTSVRTLEFLADEQGRVAPRSGMCNLFIYPGYRFKCVDAMITNFHLPESTLLMLVSAFYTREGMLSAYQEAIEKEYRFFSYGDAMLIE